MKNTDLRKSFLMFSSFIVFYAIFYLYFKHDVGNDTSISEWSINYSGGFTRRGFGGEINMFISKIFDISLRDSIFFLQSLSHTIYIILLYFFLVLFYPMISIYWGEAIAGLSFVWQWIPPPAAQELNISIRFTSRLGK